MTTTYGLREVRLRVLAEVRARGAVPLSGLPHRWPLTRAALTATARQLVDEGLLSREADPRTGRPDLLRLTVAGERALAVDQAA
ncbi:MAG TPA: MarR family winged helix-turn-helix transcriptional regulator [Gemmatimonadales bacterium]|nr:MarR family winged helix-turn-helix transcriptional regulator [Gemmatimonadales bacterium]